MKLRYLTESSLTPYYTQLVGNVRDTLESMFAKTDFKVVELYNTDEVPDKYFGRGMPSGSYHTWFWRLDDTSVPEIDPADDWEDSFSPEGQGVYLTIWPGSNTAKLQIADKRAGIMVEKWLDRAEELESWFRRQVYKWRHQRVFGRRPGSTRS